MNYKLLIGGVIVAVLGLGIGASLFPKTVLQPAGGGQAFSLESIQKYIDGYLSEKPESLQNSLGAVASPDIPSPWLKWGGVTKYNGHDADLTQASTTICAIQAPTATSSLTHAAVQLSVSSTSASSLVIAKSDTAFATTTQIGTNYAIGAGAQVTVVASSTPAAGNATLFSPNQWLVVSMQGGAGGTFSPTGVCQASWTAIK